MLISFNSNYSIFSLCFYFCNHYRMCNKNNFLLNSVGIFAFAWKYFEKKITLMSCFFQDYDLLFSDSSVLWTFRYFLAGLFM